MSSDAYRAPNVSGRRGVGTRQRAGQAGEQFDARRRVIGVRVDGARQEVDDLVIGHAKLGCGRDADCSFGQEMHVTQLRRAHARAPKRVEGGIELVGRVAGPAERDEQLTAPERLRGALLVDRCQRGLVVLGRFLEAEAEERVIPRPGRQRGGLRERIRGEVGVVRGRGWLVAQRDHGRRRCRSGLWLQPLGESVALPSEDPALELAVVSGRRSHRDDGQPRAPRGVRDARADRTSKRRVVDVFDHQHDRLRDGAWVRSNSATASNARNR